MAGPLHKEIRLGAVRESLARQAIALIQPDMVAKPLESQFINVFRDPGEPVSLARTEPFIFAQKQIELERQLTRVASRREERAKGLHALDNAFAYASNLLAQLEDIMINREAPYSIDLADFRFKLEENPYSLGASPNRQKKTDSVTEGISMLLEGLGVPPDLSYEEGQARIQQQKAIWQSPHAADPDSVSSITHNGGLALSQEFFTVAKTRNILPYVFLPATDNVYVVYKQNGNSYEAIGFFLPSDANAALVASAL